LFPLPPSMSCCCAPSTTTRGKDEFWACWVQWECYRL
jgi:hypothetical protein